MVPATTPCPAIGLRKQLQTTGQRWAGHVPVQLYHRHRWQADPWVFCDLYFSALELWSQWNKRKRNWRKLLPRSRRWPRQSCCSQPRPGGHTACGQAMSASVAGSGGEGPSRRLRWCQVLWVWICCVTRRRMLVIFTKHTSKGPGADFFFKRKTNDSI